VDGLGVLLPGLVDLFDVGGGGAVEKAVGGVLVEFVGG